MLDPVLLSSIADLELVARVMVDGAMSGLHRSPFHGYSAEFSQYRQYRAGDDLKYVDWKLFARTDRFFTKQFRETTNMAAQIAIDASQSMAYRGRTGIDKFDYARLIAAALAYLISKQGDGVGIAAYHDVVREYLPSRAGASHLRQVLLALSSLKASGQTSAAGPLGRVIDLMRRRGLFIVISDLYDEDGSVERGLRRAVRAGHEVAVFHVLTRDEIDLPFSGDFELEDLETKRTVLATAVSTAAVYRRNVAEFLERWRNRCTSCGIAYTRILTDDPPDSALRGYLLKRAGAAR